MYSRITVSTFTVILDDEAVLLKDQKKFMSLNSLVMYGATRTYAEILPATTKLASKYNKATEADMKKLQTYRYRPNP